MSWTGVLILGYAVLELLSKGTGLRCYISELRDRSRRRKRYKRIRDLNYYLYSNAADECSRDYYYSVYREYADRLMTLDEER